MSAVLGIDAAWTAGQPSGVALLDEDSAGWRCVALAPSYRQFVAMVDDRKVDWSSPVAGSPPNPAALLAAAESLLGHKSVDVIAADIPLATIPIVGRRAADQEISREFGGQGCGTHSPSCERPGEVGNAIGVGFIRAGFPLAVVGTNVGKGPSLIEVYPHPALLRLTGSTYRLSYKVGNCRRYWPEASVDERISHLLCMFDAIVTHLKMEIGAIPLVLPAAATVPSFTALKRYEDAIDALVSAWVGVQYLNGLAEAFGDDTAAIWVPLNHVLPELALGQRRTERSTPV
jgi:predicted RNase H-like nuclease